MSNPTQNTCEKSNHGVAMFLYGGLMISTITSSVLAAVLSATIFLASFLPPSSSWPQDDLSSGSSKVEHCEYLRKEIVTFYASHLMCQMTLSATTQFSKSCLEKEKYNNPLFLAFNSLYSELDCPHGNLVYSLSKVRKIFEDSLSQGSGF